MSNSPGPFEHTGGCLCGAVRYGFSAEPVLRATCYCRQCQRASGSESTQIVALPRRALKLLQGMPCKYSCPGGSGQAVHRYFCGECGSQLYAEPDMYADLVSVKTCTLDHPINFAPTTSVCMEEAQVWTTLNVEETQISRLRLR